MIYTKEIYLTDIVRNIAEDGSVTYDAWWTSNRQRASPHGADEIAAIRAEMEGARVCHHLHSDTTRGWDGGA